jgi:hypothetical protein
MGWVIERTDGTTDGLGDHVVFASEQEAWEAARHAFGRDPASDEGGVTSWLCVTPSTVCASSTQPTGSTSAFRAHRTRERAS